MRGVWVVIVGACSAPAQAPLPVAPVPPLANATIDAGEVEPVVPVDAAVAPAEPPKPRLTPIAHSKHSISLTSRRDRIAISAMPAWVTLVDGALVNDEALATWMYGAIRQLSGGSYGLWGRTPMRTATDPDKPMVARYGAKAVVRAPGVVEDVIPLADTATADELWQYATKQGYRLAFVDAKDKVAPIAPVPATSKVVPKGKSRTACTHADPTLVAHVPAGGAAALLVECDEAAPLRLQTFAADRTASLRVLGALPKSELEAVMLAIAPDGTPVLIGRRAGKLALARPGADGTWSVSDMTVPARHVRGPRFSGGATWVGVKAGPGGGDFAFDETDERKVFADGVPVELRDPQGHVLHFDTLGFDTELGIVVTAEDIAGRDRASGVRTTWVLAERPPAPASVMELK